MPRSRGVIVMETFRLTAEHLLLIRGMHIGWQDCEYGAPEVDPKRPYGNSGDMIVRDIARLLGWPGADEEELSDALCERARAIHEETEIALQIVTRYAGDAVRPGLYQKRQRFIALSWEWAGAVTGD